MLNKPANSSVKLNPIIEQRWSCRAFNSEKEVSIEQIKAMCEAARWAPSCFNEQPWRVLVWNKHLDELSYKKAFACIGEWNQRWVKNAPVIFSLNFNPRFLKNNKDNFWAMYDCGSAAENICLEAVNQGLMAHPMAGVDFIKLKNEFSFPEEIIPVSVIAVGYQAEADILDDEMKASEIAPRERKELNENFFFAEWGRGLTELK